MINRLKALAVTFLILITITTFASAVEINEVSQGIENNTAELTSLKQILNTKFAVLEKKVDTFATKEDVTAMLSVHLIKINEIMDWFRSILIVSFILIGVSLLGLGYSIYFYFKSRGRI